MMQAKLQEPALEEYKREISVYKNYRERLNNLEKIRESLRPHFLFCFGACFFVILLISMLSGEGFWLSITISTLLSFYISLFSLGSDFLANIFSFGKFNKVKRQIKEIEELLRDSYSKLQPFEKEFRDYYESQLAEFFVSNLYKKRSGNQEFEEALSEFSSMLKELSRVNSFFVTTRIPLREHESYLIKRTIDHSFQSSKESKTLASVRNFVRSVSELQEQKEIIAPEKLYRTVRKIDNWDEINKKRRITGFKGEEIAVAMEQDFFMSINRKDLADKVRHVSVERGDGLGYDVLSFSEDGREKYIEVKSTTTTLNSPYYLSKNELQFLKDHRKDAFIYRFLISDGIPQVKAYSSEEVLKINEIIPVQYIVHGKSNESMR